MDGVGAEHDLHMRHLSREGVPIPLSDASAYGDDPLPQRGGCPQGLVLQRHDMSEQARISGFSDTACHEDDDIGLFRAIDLCTSQGFEHADDALGVMLVHLAAERLRAERQSVKIVAHGGEGCLLLSGDGLSGRSECSARLDGESDGSAVFAIYHDVGERWDANDLYAHR